MSCLTAVAIFQAMVLLGWVPVNGTARSYTYARPAIEDSLTGGVYGRVPLQLVTVFLNDRGCYAGLVHHLPPPDAET